MQRDFVLCDACNRALGACKKPCFPHVLFPLAVTLRVQGRSRVTLLMASESLLTLMVGPGSWSECFCCLVCLGGVVFLAVHPEPPTWRDKVPPSMRLDEDTQSSRIKGPPVGLGPKYIKSDPSPRSDPSCGSIPPDKSLTVGTDPKAPPSYGTDPKAPPSCDECRDAAARVSELRQQLLAAQGLAVDVGAENKDLGSLAEALKSENALLEKQLEEVSTETERLQVWRRKGSRRSKRVWVSMKYEYVFQ